MFPIKRLPSVDKRPRYAASDVERYERGELKLPSGYVGKKGGRR